MRYLPHTSSDRRYMLDKIGIDKIDILFDQVPKKARLKGLLELPNHLSEMEVENYFISLSEKNLVAGKVPFFLGGGAYRHHIPATVDSLIQRGEFLTSYTPYQPEISQGTLQSLFEYQTQVSRITGMEISNASMYDGSTACAEAALMAARITKRNKIALCSGLHPHWSEVTETFCCTAGHEIYNVGELNPKKVDIQSLISNLDSDTACLILQLPNVFGSIYNIKTIADYCNDIGVLLVVAITEIVSLGAIESPGFLGADIVVAEGQSLGVGLNFGGPYVGLFATKKKYVRHMPGRIVGETLDNNNNRGWVLTLATREQHIRREKATSNICTNSGLCALAFSIHLSLLGSAGFRKLSLLNHRNAIKLAQKLENIKNVKVMNDRFFNEFTIQLPMSAQEVCLNLAKKGILAGIPLSRLYKDNSFMSNMMLVAVTETVTDSHIDHFIKVLEEEIH